MNVIKEENIYINKKKGYYMQNKEEKDIKVKVVYGNKPLLECMKNIIKNSRKWWKNALYGVSIYVQYHMGYNILEIGESEYGKSSVIP